MKRIICWLVVLVITLGIVGCNGEELKKTEESDSGFRVGYGKADVTPYTPVNLGGFGDNATRMSQGYINPLSALSALLQICSCGVF